MSLPQRLLRVVPVAMVLVVAWWAASRDNDDYCGTVGECLGHSLDDAVTIAVALPLSWLSIRLLGVPRALLTSLAVVTAVGLGWFAVEALLDAADPDRPAAALVPLRPVLVMAVAAALVGVVAAGPPRSRFERVARFAAPALLLATTLLAGMLADHVDRAETAADVEATGLTTYEPVLGGVRPSSVSVHDGRVQLHYVVTDGDDTTYPAVALVPSPPGRRLCEELITAAGDDCVDDGTRLRRIHDGYADVALVRGDTTLLVQFFDTDVLDPEQVLDELATAEPVPAEELAD